MTAKFLEDNSVSEIRYSDDTIAKSAKRQQNTKVLRLHKHSLPQRHQRDETKNDDREFQIRPNCEMAKIDRNRRRNI